MWLSYALVAFATRPKEKQHDEIPPVRMTYTGGTGGDHGHDLGSGSIYTHHTSCDEAHCETGCENVDESSSCDQAFCARLNGCDHAADCDESPCDDWYSAILSCDVTDGGESCDHGCPYSLAGAYHDGTDGANNEAGGVSTEDCGFLNAGDCGR